MGYRVATAAMRQLGVQRPYDEELVCVAETDACGVDAVQVMTGCTAGKGNLFIRDYGKHVFTFISRESGRAIRILVRQEDLLERLEMDFLRKRVFSGAATTDEQVQFQSLMQTATVRILEIPEAGILDIREVSREPPGKARIFTSIACTCCGEPVSDAKTRMVNGSRVCIPCADSLSIEGERGTP
jgi:formylmethanofuran dehydrogenase subunit E